MSEYYIGGCDSSGIDGGDAFPGFLVFVKYPQSFEDRIAEMSGQCTKPRRYVRGDGELTKRAIAAEEVYTTLNNLGLCKTEEIEVNNGDVEKTQVGLVANYWVENPEIRKFYVDKIGSNGREEILEALRERSFEPNGREIICQGRLDRKEPVVMLCDHIARHLFLRNRYLSMIES